MAVYRPNPVLLERQLDSLRAQTVADWRCLVGIDGHDPATLSLVRDIIGSDDRFEVLHFDTNFGVYRHFERLLGLVTEDVSWIALADQDDVWHSDKFERLLPALLQPGVTAVTGQARVVNENGVELGVTRRRPGPLLETLLLNQLTGSLALLRREILDIAFPFPTATGVAIHDHWLAVCAASKGRIELVNTVVQDYVQHGSNVLGEVQDKTLRQSFRDAGGVAGAVRAMDYRSQWGWSVSMAVALLPREVPVSESATLATIARNRVGSRSPYVLASLVRRRLMPARVAASLLLSAFRSRSHPWIRR